MVWVGLVNPDLNHVAAMNIELDGLVQWLDGSVFERATWDAQELDINRATENYCMAKLTDERLGDVGCTTLKPYLCQYDCDNLPGKPYLRIHST